MPLELKGGLLSREITKSTAVGRATTATTAASATTSSATITEPTESTTATTTAKSSTCGRVAVLGTGLAVVETDGTVLDVTTLHGLKSSFGLVDRAKGDITETLGGTSLTVSRQADAHDRSMRSECLGNILLSAVKGEVAKEQCVGRLAELVSIGLATVVGRLVVIAASVGKVNIQGTAIELSALLGGIGFGGIGGVNELDITESKSLLVM